MTLHAYVALESLLDGTGGLDDWREVASVCNLVNALFRSGRLKSPAIQSCVLESLFSLRDAVLENGVIQMDLFAKEPLKLLIATYDKCLQTMARRTILDGYDLIDACVAEQNKALMLIDRANLSENIPMLTEPDVEDEREALDLQRVAEQD